MQFVIVCVANKNISVTESDVGTTGGRIMKIGEKFTFKGYEWVALEVNKDNVWAIMTKAWDTAEFDENNRNDWKNSSIRKRLREELLPILGEENLITRSVDLVADNGDRMMISGSGERSSWLTVTLRMIGGGLSHRGTSMTLVTVIMSVSSTLQVMSASIVPPIASEWPQLAYSILHLWHLLRQGHRKTS